MANRPGAALKNHLRDSSIEASLSIPVTKALFPPGRWAADGGPALAGLHDPAFSRAIDPANRILGQDSSEQATLLVEPSQALLFKQPETALRHYAGGAIQPIHQPLEVITQ